MGWLSWLVDLEPRALRQAKCVHNATWHFWIIFSGNGIAEAVMGKTGKILFQMRNMLVVRRIQEQACPSGHLICADRRKPGGTKWRFKELWLIYPGKTAAVGNA